MRFIYDRLGTMIVRGSIIAKPTTGTVVVVTKLARQGNKIVLHGIVLESDGYGNLLGVDRLFGIRRPGFIADCEVIGFAR